VGPPTSGWITAYNPITGESYSSEPDGVFFKFEAAGALVFTGLTAPLPGAVFGARAFVWERVNEIRLLAIRSFQERIGPMRSVVVRIGEGDKTRLKRFESSVVMFDGSASNRRHTLEFGVRDKHLVAFTVFDESLLRRRYGVARASEPIGMCSSPNPPAASIVRDYERRVAQIDRQVRRIKDRIEAAQEAGNPPRARDIRALERVSYPRHPVRFSAHHELEAKLLYRTRAVPFATMAEAAQDQEADATLRYLSAAEMRERTVAQRQRVADALRAGESSGESPERLRDALDAIDGS
jgi:hypothetical protein